MAVDPKNSSTIYASLVAGGIWKSTNGGATWANKSAGFPTPLQSDLTILVIDPVNTNTVYAAGGNGRLFLPDFNTTSVTDRFNGSICLRKFGVFKSTNGGDTWSEMTNGLANPRIRSLVVDPSNPLILYAATEGNLFTSSLSPVTIFKSINGGASWSPSDSGITPPAEINSIAIDPLNGANLYGVGAVQSTANQRLFRSTNGGNTWTQLESVCCRQQEQTFGDLHRGRSLVAVEHLRWVAEVE